MAHVDYLDEDAENEHFDDILNILHRNTVENLFIDLLIIAEEYEKFKQCYGHSMTEQMDIILAHLSGN